MLLLSFTCQLQSPSQGAAHSCITPAVRTYPPNVHWASTRAWRLCLRAFATAVPRLLKLCASPRCELTRHACMAALAVHGRSSGPCGCCDRRHDTRCVCSIVQCMTEVVYRSRVAETTTVVWWECVPSVCEVVTTPHSCHSQTSSGGNFAKWWNWSVIPVCVRGEVFRPSCSVPLTVCRPLHVVPHNTTQLDATTHHVLHTACGGSSTYTGMRVWRPAVARDHAWSPCQN